MGRIKHVVYILPYLNQGGTERQALSLIREYQHRYRVSLLAPTGKGLPPFLAQQLDYCEFTAWERNFFKGLRELIAGIKVAQKRQSIDLIHVHGAHELMIPVRLLFPNLPIVFTVHGYHGASAEISYRLACLFANLWATRVISICQAEYDILVKFGMNPAKLEMIYNGVPTPILDRAKVTSLAERFNLDPLTQTIIGTAARLSEAKGLTYLLQAFAKVAQGKSNLRLVIAGVGELEQQLKQQSQELGIADRTIFAGYIDDLPELTSLFNFFVLPSLQEPFGLVVAEAMAQSKATIGTDVSGIAEQIADGKTGFLIPSKDVDALAKKMQYLLDRPELVDEFARNGRQRYERYFGLDRMLIQTENLYSKLIN
ncbi:glycosyltransferase family 4 protein [Chamaesiphon polymorphus]|uniref:Glycosyltransferase family 1 protein n=1 Tax=Chamaesiphon polymorphus CCALA 037 TaxID=2107692 RepID=A0A2T1G7G7_9CYAN|nr:glycosyltransferase family 4 protein [Chamaesiphon polymorphus]PSB53130.1 glycosyltransferase family 1 protein [Chamaesiphon polymorphus CCALA 037]